MRLVGWGACKDVRFGGTQQHQQHHPLKCIDACNPLAPACLAARAFRRPHLACLPPVDQCTYDYQGIGVCVESVDDNCLLSGASQLRGATLMCGSSSSWSTMRHQAFLYHHQAFGGTVGSDSSRCYALEGAAKVCRSSGKGNGTTTCLLRNAMCIDTVCGAKGSVSAVFKFDNGQDVTVPCPSGGLKGGHALP